MRPANGEDFVRNFKRPSQRTVRAWVVDKNGEDLAIIGFYMDAGRVAIFAEIKDEAREKCKWPGRLMLTSGRFVLQQAIKTGMPIFAVADSSVKGSRTLLERLGFQEGYKETMVWAPPQSL